MCIMAILVIGVVMNKDATTIRISTDLREKLKELGKKGETYEEIIAKLVQMAEATSGGKH